MTPAPPKPTVVAAKPKPPVDKKPTGSAEQLYKKATELYLAGNFAAAEAAYKQALAIDRGYAPALRGLGFLYQRTGDPAKAIDALRRYLKLNPNAGDAAAVRKRLDQLGG